MSACQTWVGPLASGIVHFLKVTNSYLSGIFHCYSIDGLPRTNNDLEHIFGTVRHHHRRCTGRKVAPASLILRGSVQLVASNCHSTKNLGCRTLNYCFNSKLARFAFWVRAASY